MRKHISLLSVQCKKKQYTSFMNYEGNYVFLISLLSIVINIYWWFLSFTFFSLHVILFLKI